MNKLAMPIAAAILATSVIPTPAAYIPDNNGRYVFKIEPAPIHTVKAKKKRHAHATRKSKRKAVASSGMRWNMVKVRTVQGLYLEVHPAYAHKFLRLFELLAQKGIKVPREIVGCYSPGHKPGSNHRIGAACDIQTGWNKTIPAMYHAGDLIKAAGLYDGCSFGDCGHVEAVRGLYNKAPNLYASVQKFKQMEATLNYQP